MSEHITVLKRESIEYLSLKPHSIVVDCTLGGGGHSLEIIKNLHNGILLAFDLDKQSIQNFKNNFENCKQLIPELIEITTDKNKIYLVNDNFDNLEKYLDLLKIDSIDALLADLGWSSDQLNSLQGLSFENLKANLDMRFDSRLNIKASDLLNILNKKQLKKMFEEYADVRGKENYYLVEQIVKDRDYKHFKTVKDFVDTVNRAYRFKYYQNAKVYAPIFQALRIAVNSELNNLESLLQVAFKKLNPNGRLAIITFHSGEEKIVTKFIEQNKSQIEIITKSLDGDFIRPEITEVSDNRRARSAKLFTVAKTK